MTNTPDFIEKQLNHLRMQLTAAHQVQEAFRAALESGLASRGLELAKLSAPEILTVVRIVGESSPELAIQIESMTETIVAELHERMVQASVQFHTEHGQTVAARVAAVLRPGSAS